MITKYYVTKFTKDYLQADSIQEIDRIINIIRTILNKIQLMTQEEKAKAYDEALRRAKEINNEQRAQPFDVMTKVFPELKKSNDERIRKEIIEIFKNLGNGKIPVDINYADIFTWLEKQGEKYMKHSYITANPEFFQWIYDRLKYVYNENPNVDYMLSLKERIEDMQKFADKIKPKFKVGDWIIDNKNRVGIIVRILDGHYIISFDGREVQISFEWEGKLLRKWSIQDAKDGDVLASDNSIFIFQEEYIAEKPIAYCGLMNGRFLVDGEDACWTNERYYPATKEQCNILFTKMKEAGYEWDAEKKELKKISQRIVSAEVKEALYDKPAWSEEDENKIDTIISVYHPSPNIVDWLKSIKQRIRWKPSDAQIEALGVATDICSIPEKQYDELNKLYYDLKKLAE